MEPGWVADLIAVQGDPTERIGALRDPQVVILRGAVVLDRRVAPGFSPRRLPGR